jgi:hypothetical protein
VRYAITYVLLNTRRHLAQRGRRLPARRAVDPASSGRWFLAWRERVERSHDPPAVTKPRSWLLSVGWLRWGRISLAEVPGG